MDSNLPTPTLAQRWSILRPTKTTTVWCCAASILATLVLGFTWGGWVTGATARTMAAAAGEEALLRRLAPICLVQFQGDPNKADKLKQLETLASWQQADFVKEQGWATMPGERNPESRIAEECVRLVIALDR